MTDTKVHAHNDFPLLVAARLLPLLTLPQMTHTRYLGRANRSSRIEPMVSGIVIVSQATATRIQETIIQRSVSPRGTRLRRAFYSRTLQAPKTHVLEGSTHVNSAGILGVASVYCRTYPPMIFFMLDLMNMFCSTKRQYKVVVLGQR